MTQFTWTFGRNTLSQPKNRIDSERLKDLPPLPQDEEGPVFAEPWQAQAFALAVKLSEAGHFTWKEWAEALANELNEAEQRGEPDDGTHYYNHWVAALERIVTEKGLTEFPTLEKRKDEWEHAFKHTPHGEPVVLPDQN